MLSRAIQTIESLFFMTFYCSRPRPPFITGVLENLRYRRNFISIFAKIIFSFGAVPVRQTAGRSLFFLNGSRADRLTI